MEILKKLFEIDTQLEVSEMKQLTPAGSNRQYFRLMNGDCKRVGVIGTSVEENRAFFALAKQFEKVGVNAPKLLQISGDEVHYLISDLGDLMLFDAFKTGAESGKFTDEQKQLVLKTIRELPKIQYEVACDFDFSNCYPQAAFNERSVFWDLNYFKYSFLKTTGVEFNEDLLEDEFQKFAQILVKEQTNTFMYRDFQSRNVMLVDNTPYFIDFQGGRKGPIYYDVASFVYQAKANFPKLFKEELIEAYCEALQQYNPISKSDFQQKFAYFLLFRTLQVLGAYGFRGRFEQKAHFIQSIPFALHNLKEILTDNRYPELPYLVDVLKQMLECQKDIAVESYDKLCVKVYSFSYKKGIPVDYTGNGGGYVFDCRALHNPGRYEPYKKLTGRDASVIKFIEESPTVAEFLKSVYAIADISVSKYIERGFKNLQFSFGCTGGQHRSVYGAEHLATYLKQKYGDEIIVDLIHREQKIREIK